MTAEQRLRQGASALEVDLNDAQVDYLLRFAQELLHWNRRINLSAIRTLDEAVEKHLLDSLTLLPWIPDGRLLDIGSGGGFPGFPLKIVRPDLHLTSVDSVGKKIQFQRHMVRLLALKDVTPIDDRIETLAQRPDYTGPYTCIVSRAFSDLTTMVQLGLPLLKADGLMIAMKGADGENELAQIAAELQRWQCQAEVLQQLSLPFSHSQRCLIKITRI